jgi:hypothetical protein
MLLTNHTLTAGPDPTTPFPAPVVAMPAAGTGPTGDAA